MNTKISYLRDPKAPERVFTLVSRVNGDKVEYGFALNRPTRWVKSQGGKSSRYEDLIKGDKFNKARGRQIAEARLAVDPMVADLAGREPDVAILETLRDASDNSLIRRIADSKLQICMLRALIKRLEAQATGQKIDAPNLNTQGN